MKMYKQGQRIKVEFENDFHGTKAIGICTIVGFEGDYWTVELPLNTRNRIRNKLCPFSDCSCQKIDKATAIESGKEVLLTY